MCGHVCLDVLAYTHSLSLSILHKLTNKSSFYVHCSLLTVGNKNDCPEKKVVQADDAQKFAEQIGVQLYETSAKENINVEEVCVCVTSIYMR